MHTSVVIHIDFMDDEHIMINIHTYSCYLALSCTGFYMSSNLLCNTQYFIIITNQIHESLLQLRLLLLPYQWISHHHIHIYIHTHIHVHTYIHTYMHPFIHSFIHSSIHPSSHPSYNILFSFTRTSWRKSYINKSISTESKINHLMSIM